MALVPDDCSRTYEVLRPLGTGGFGTVFLAKHRELGREVALKVLKHEMVLDQEQRQRFLDEARVTAQLSDPHVVKVLDHGIADVPWIAYEYLPGRSVKDMLTAGPIQWREAVKIAAQVAAALEAAHGAGVIHRDIKAENVLEASPGHFKVADFGIARWAGSQVQTQAGFVMGTPTHMAPEMWNGAPAGQKSDLYALGVMLYELLVGQLPFDGSNVSEILNAHLEQAPATPGRLQPDVPPALSDLVKKALAKEPEDRFALAKQLREALELIKAEERIGGSRPGLPRPLRSRATGPTRPVSVAVAPPPKRTGWLLAGAAGALLALSAVALLRPPTVPTPGPPDPPTTRSPDQPISRSLDQARLIEDLRVIARVACGAFSIAIEDDSNLLQIGGVKPIKNVEIVRPVVEQGVEKLSRMLLEARGLEPGPVWGLLTVLALETLRPVSLLLPEQRPAAMQENLRKIALVTRANSADPFRGAFEAVVGGRVEALIRSEADGTKQTANKIAWAVKQLEMLESPRWGAFLPARGYALLSLTHIEIEQRQSQYRHLGALDTASTELMLARRRGAAYARALVDAQRKPGDWAADERTVLVEFYMQMGRLLKDPTDPAERARFQVLADDMWTLFEGWSLTPRERKRVVAKRADLEALRR